MDRCQVRRWYHVKKQMCMVCFNNRDWILTSLITPLGPGIQQGLKRPAYVHRTKWNLMFLCHISFSFILYMQSLYLEKIPELWDTPEKGSEYVCISQYKLCYATVMILRSQWPSGLTLFSSFVGSSPGQLWLCHMWLPFWVWGRWKSLYLEQWWSSGEQEKRTAWRTHGQKAWLMLPLTFY